MSRRELANAIRALSMDAVQKANSGHPVRQWGWQTLPKCCGTIFSSTIRRTLAGWTATAFILSNGHASMLLYSLLHLSGYDLPLSELKQFRQLHSKTPGHPEHGYTPGVETTTGRWARGWRTPSVWPSPNAPWRRSLTAPVMRLSTITPGFSWAMVV